MKKFISLILCLILCLSLFACNSEQLPTEDTQETKQTEGTKKTQQTQSTDNSTEEDNSSNTEEKPIIPGVQIPDLSSYVKTDVAVEDGKIQLNGNIVYAAIADQCLSLYSENLDEYNIVILDHDLQALEYALSNLKLEKTDESVMHSIYPNVYTITIYFDDGSYIGFDMSSGGPTGKYIGIDETVYIPQTTKQGSDLLHAFSMPYTEQGYRNMEMIIDNNFILFQVPITKLRFFVYKEVKDITRNYIRNEMELSAYRYENESLNSLVDIFKSIELGTPEEVSPDSSDHMEVTFYPQSNENRSYDGYMIIRILEIDGVHYFKIDGSYYPVKDSDIERLYSKLTIIQ